MKLSAASKDVPTVKSRRSIFLLEPDLGSLEKTYRENSLSGDAAQARMLIILGAILSLAYAPIDYQLLGPSTLLAALYLARTLFITLSLLIVLALRQVRSVQRMDWLVLGWTMAAVMTILLINIAREGAFFYNVVLDLTVMVLFYTALPNPLSHRLLPALLLSLGDVILLQFFRNDIELLGPRALDDVTLFGMRAIIVAFVIGNIAAGYVSIRLHSYRRTQFEAQYHEQALREEFERLAKLDSLTSALNRRRFMELADREFLRFSRYKHPLSIMLIDLDHFKTVNDTFGHLAGDEVLKQFVTLASSRIRQIDVLGRVGGEEFAIVLPETCLENAIDVAQRIREGCEQMAVQVAQSTIHVTISIGLTSAYAGDTSFDDVFNRSDQTLYRAKQAGRNQVAWTPTG